ncbi:MAG: hypothetical protein Kow00121_51620 [Elainellaceae cyanobacterium]
MASNKDKNKHPQVDRQLTQKEARENSRMQNSFSEKSIEPPEQRLQATEEGGILREVDIDNVDLNNIVSDDTDNAFVTDDSTDNEPFSGGVYDAPQEETQSLGTGLQGHPSDRTGRRAHYSHSTELNRADPTLTGGDVDADYEQASMVGDEAVGGTVATPDQDVVDEIGAAVGLEMDDRSFLRTQDILEERDNRRWELDPESSENYDEHQP